MHGLKFRSFPKNTTTLQGARYAKNFREFSLKGKHPRANISFSQKKTQLVSRALSFAWKRGSWERGLIQRLVNMILNNAAVMVHDWSAEKQSH